MMKIPRAIRTSTATGITIIMVMGIAIHTATAMVTVMACIATSVIQMGPER